MSEIPGTAAVREHSTRYGVLTVGLGLVLLLGLRLWASPVARRATGRGANGLVEFLAIPAFLVVVAVGIGLFLWEPDADPR